MIGLPTGAIVHCPAQGLQSAVFGNVGYSLRLAQIQVIN